MFCKAKEKPALKTYLPAPRPPRKILQEETLLRCIERFAGKPLPPYEAEALITLANRMYLTADGTEMEVMRTGGCDRHLVSRDGDLHFCVCQDRIRELPRQPVKWACLETCPHMKEAAREILAKSEGHIDEPTRNQLLEFINRENTIDWD